MTTSPSHRAQEILLTFAAEGEPTPKRLEAFTKEYPDLRRELTDLAVELVLEPSRPVPAADAATARTVSSAWARFQAGIASPRRSPGPARWSSLRRTSSRASPARHSHGSRPGSE
ncbi:hypothetical protein GCM10025880_11560 [Methylorubrum aminovorans]|nr:hypothetical protein GCM10025880_11560 [Methylorubrum aminovorans]